MSENGIVQYEACIIGEKGSELFHVSKVNGRYFVKILFEGSNTESFEISRVTYCALLVDTKLAESLL